MERSLLQPSSRAFDPYSLPEQGALLRVCLRMSVNAPEWIDGYLGGEPKRWNQRPEIRAELRRRAQ
jgi:hypothetical protein